MLNSEYENILDYIQNRIQPQANFQKIMLQKIIQNGQSSKEEIDEEIIKQNPGKDETFHSFEVYETLVDKQKIVKYDDDSKVYTLNISHPLTSLEKSSLLQNLRDYFVAMGNWPNWKISLSQLKTLWGVNPNDKSGHYKFLKEGDIVFYHCKKDDSPFQESGVIGVGIVRKKFFDDKTKIFEEEKDHAEWTLRFECEDIRILNEKESNLLIQHGLVIHKGLWHLVKSEQIERIINLIQEKWNVSLDENIAETISETYDLGEEFGSATLEKNIEELIIKFDKNRNFRLSTPQWVKDGEQQREYFISKFPEDKILEIKIDDYVAGKVPKNRDSFSNLVEFGTKSFGRVGGGSAWKHGVFVKKATQEYQFRVKAYNSIEEAYSTLINGINDIVKSGREFGTDVDYSKLNQKVEGRKYFLTLSIITKILALYHPDIFLRIWSHEWMNNAIDIFGIQNDLFEENSEFYKKHIALMRLKDAHPILKHWTKQFFSEFIRSIIDGELITEEPGVEPLQVDLKQFAEQIIQFNFPLALEHNLVERILRHLNAGKHVVLVGAPGVGKTELAKRILTIYGEEITGKKYLPSVASAEWTRREVVGGLDLENNFIPGCVTKAAQEKRWLLIDEFNRADINKAFGEMFLAIEDKHIPLRQDEKNAISDEYIKIPNEFRMICTMNDFDKNLLLTELSYGLITRFAFVDVNPDTSKEQDSVKKQILVNPEISEKEFNLSQQQISAYFEFINLVRDQRMIGVRTSIDVIKYVTFASKNIIQENLLWVFLDEALRDYLLPQFDRLDRKILEHTKTAAQKHVKQCSNFINGLDKMIVQLEKVSSFFGTKNE